MYYSPSFVSAAVFLGGGVICYIIAKKLLLRREKISPPKGCRNSPIWEKTFPGMGKNIPQYGKIQAPEGEKNNPPH